MEEILKNVKMQFGALGYGIQNDDPEMLKYLIDKITSQILYTCGTDEIEKPLSYVIADKVCAEHIKNKIVSGKDVGINIASNAKDIKIGDVSISFPENSTYEEKINMIITKLERNDFDYSPYSKMRW